MSYPFKNTGVNRNRLIVNTLAPSVDAGLGAVTVNATNSITTKPNVKIVVGANSRALIDFADSGNLNQLSAHIYGTQTGQVTDGVATTFPTAFPVGYSPTIVFHSGGLVYDSTLPAGNQIHNFQAQDVSNTGFTPSLKIQTASGVTTPHSNTFSGSGPWTATTTSAPAYDNNYTVNFSSSISSGGYAKVYISVSGTNYWSKFLSPSNNGSWSPVISIPGLTSTSVITITFEIINGTGSITPTTVTYNTATAPTVHTATPSGSTPVTYFAY